MSSGAGGYDWSAAANAQYDPAAALREARLAAWYGMSNDDIAREIDAAMQRKLTAAGCGLSRTPESAL